MPKVIKRLEKVIENKDYLITNEINGQVIAVLRKGLNQVDRLSTALKEEFCCNDFEVSDVDTTDGISFTINSEEDGVNQFIKLLTAHNY